MRVWLWTSYNTSSIHVGLGWLVISRLAVRVRWSDCSNKNTTKRERSCIWFYFHDLMKQYML